MELDELFKFPIIMIDRKQEEKNEMLSLPNDDSGAVIGEGEEPWYEFSGSIRDYWIPGDNDSYMSAKEGNFEACFVRFKSSDYIVPWNKEKFKKLWNKFKNEISEKESPKDKTKIIFIEDSKFELIMEKLREIEEEEGEVSDEGE